MLNRTAGLSATAQLFFPDRLEACPTNDKYLSPVGQASSLSRRNSASANKSRCCANSQRGFTLVETLIATALLALVFATVYSVFNVGAQAGSRRSAEIHLSARASLELIGKELRSACFRPGADKYLVEGESAKRGDSETDTISFCSIEKTKFPDGGEFPTPVRITYMISPHPGSGENALYRTIEKIDGKDAGDIETQPVAPFVKELEIQYETGGSWGNKWESRDIAPDRIRVRLGLAESDAAKSRQWFEIETDIKAGVLKEKT